MIALLNRCKYHCTDCTLIWCYCVALSRGSRHKLRRAVPAMLCRIILAHFARLTNPVHEKRSSSASRDVKRSSIVRHKLCFSQKRGSPLLDLWAAQSSVNALVHEAPVDLVEHLIDVARFGAEEGALAIGR